MRANEQAKECAEPSGGRHQWMVFFNSRKNDSPACVIKRVSGESAAQRNKDNAIRTTLLLLTAYAVCWFPYNVVSFWQILSKSTFANVEIYIQAFESLIVLNSVVNPVIYGRLTLLNLKK